VQSNIDDKYMIPPTEKKVILYNAMWKFALTMYKIDIIHSKIEVLDILLYTYSSNIQNIIHNVEFI